MWLLLTFYICWEPSWKLFSLGPIIKNRYSYFIFGKYYMRPTASLQTFEKTHLSTILNNVVSRFYCIWTTNFLPLSIQISGHLTTLLPAMKYNSSCSMTDLFTQNMTSKDNIGRNDIYCLRHYLLMKSLRMTKIELYQFLWGRIIIGR